MWLTFSHFTASSSTLKYHPTLVCPQAIHKQTMWDVVQLVSIRSSCIHNHYVSRWIMEWWLRKPACYIPSQVSTTVCVFVGRTRWNYLRKKIYKFLWVFIVVLTLVGSWGDPRGIRNILCVCMAWKRNLCSLHSFTCLISQCVGSLRHD